VSRKKGSLICALCKHLRNLSSWPQTCSIIQAWSTHVLQLLWTLLISSGLLLSKKGLLSPSVHSMLNRPGKWKHLEFDTSCSFLLILSWYCFVQDFYSSALVLKPQAITLGGELRRKIVGICTTQVLYPVIPG